jgi:hypothetical protein
MVELCPVHLVLPSFVVAAFTVPAPASQHRSHDDRGCVDAHAGALALRNDVRLLVGKERLDEPMSVGPPIATMTYTA